MPATLAGLMQLSALSVVKSVSGFVWGPYCLIPLLLLTGLFLTVRLRGVQFTRLGHALWMALVVRKERGAEGDISHFQALMTALAATVGTGNIAGVATAIAVGGPGALFWMWVTGLLGMATKYAEALLSVRFREPDVRGEQCGGPMYYLAKGVRPTRLGVPLGGSFAVLGAIASLGIGNMVQSNSVADALSGSFGVAPTVTGVVAAVVAGAVIIGGIRSIGRFAGVFVPAMIAAYMIGSGVVLVRFAAELPAAFWIILRDAFSGSAAVAGFAGATLRQTLRYGVARGIFSNESGLGSAGIAAAAAQTAEPVRQAMVSMTQTFIDTIVVCSFTGLAIVATGAWSSGEDGAQLTQLAFRLGLPGRWGGWVVAISLSTFAFSTLLGWSYYGERCVEYLFGVQAVFPYRAAFVGAIFLGATLSLHLVWNIADVMCGAMALPNLVGLLLLSGVAARASRDYFAARGPVDNH